MSTPFKFARLDEIPTPVPPDAGWYEWKPVRHHFDIRAFGVNAQLARSAGDQVVEEHDEIAGGAARHEELYVVLRGAARFTIADREVDVPSGSAVFVGDPVTKRAARALEDDTLVLVIGAARGEAFRVSPWEARHFPGDAS